MGDKFIVSILNPGKEPADNGRTIHALKLAKELKEGGAEVMVLLGGGLAGLPLPLLPLQILWLNLVTDTFPALALALEPGEQDVMRRAPRAPNAPILSGHLMGSVGLFAALITLSTLVAYVYGLETGPGDRAVTLSFMTLALAQLSHLGNARSRGPVLRPSSPADVPGGSGSR